MKSTKRWFAGVFLCAGAALGQDSALLIERLTGPSSRLETDLRVLTDQIGGRVTGSAGYEKALRWGVDGFHRAGLDTVKLESYPVPAKWEAISASAAVVAPSQFPLRVVSLGLAPSTSGVVTAATIAERRASAEAKEGLTAFLEKRKPAWAKEIEK